ncbi:hypothetical protein J5N97_000882 [Dioscorea zingiberensis]|nr:hypothetical protein J5N97_000882 [Dioscorea zingiberensis]
MSVPAFGEWDKKPGVADYSSDFTKIREARKLNKTRISVGNEDELLPRHADHHQLTVNQHNQHQTSPPSAKWKRILSYFTCCTTT